MLEGDSDVTYSYNYQGYVQVVLNTLSAGILDLKCLNEIIDLNHRKNKEMSYTNTLMLFYGAVLKANTGLNEDQAKVLQEQRKYLKYLTGRYCLLGS